VTIAAAVNVDAEILRCAQDDTYWVRGAGEERGVKVHEQKPMTKKASSWLPFNAYCVGAILLR
jgi:hypothetical protein